MTHVFLSLGAINKQTGEYVFPKIANKKDEYVCPDCNKDLTLCQGEIIRPYFRHKVDSVNPCHHYSNPTETQIHKDGKMVIKSLLERKTPISFIRNCCSCKKNEEHEIPEMTESSKIELEYRFEYNGTKIADVVYIDNDDILCIFEICNTHKTCSENRPEPWFEIDAETLIKLANDNALPHIKIPCIRCEKCDDCIEKERYNIVNKKKALDILYQWLNTGVDTPPFIYDYAIFSGIEKNVKCDVTGEMFDLILYVEPKEKWQRYCIRLIYNSSNYYFVKEHNYAELLIGVYYLDIDWILHQTKIPERIKYTASLDCYEHTELSKDCRNCKTNCPFWVKRIDMCGDYKVIYIGCVGCDFNDNTEYVTCERCNTCNTQLCLMETNVVSRNICKSCDIELFSSCNIYLHVSFSEKDEAKKLGAVWDSKYRRWFINKNNKDIELILQKWKRIW
jgi:uncharacterized protein YkuJ